MSMYKPSNSFVLRRRDAKRRMDSLRIGRTETLGKTVDLSLSLLGESLSTELGTFTASAIQHTWRELIEDVDAIDILIRSGAIGPARIIGRTVLELTAAIRYLAARNNEQVSAARLLAAGREAERRYFALIEGNDDGKEELREALLHLRKERINSEYASHAQLKAAQALDALPEGAPWYSVFGGPSGPAQLLNQADMALAYRKFFLPWNWVVHGVSVESLSTVNSKKYSYRPLRHYSKESMEHFADVLNDVATLAMASAYRYFFPRRPPAAQYEQVVEGFLKSMKAVPGDYPQPWGGD